MITSLMPLLLSIESARQTIPVVVWALFIGISAATFSLWFRQAVLGRAVRALKEKNALHPQDARTAEELGIAKNPVILRSIHKGSLARYIHTVKLTEEDPAEREAGPGTTEESGETVGTAGESGETGSLGEKNVVIPPRDKTAATADASVTEKTNGRRFGYYLDEEKSIQADLRYSSKGTSLYYVIIGWILYLIVTFLLARYLPELAVKYLGKYL